MLESFNVKREMEYERLSPQEQEKRGILGRLVGIIADFKNPTRNGRKYSEELWDKTFSNPIMIEKIENRCLFGELGHPVDRTEIDMEKIAICMAEVPKKGSDGKLYGVFDILATPNGRILKTMCDYGCKIGVSSRGCGDTVEDYDGTESVEPDSYDCECWDAVLLPAVKSARPKYVTESLTNEKTLRKALKEAIDSSTDEDKKTMEDTLERLEIDYSTDEEDVSESVDNIEDNEIVDEPNESVTKLNDETAENSGVDILEELQDSWKTQAEQKDMIKELQEKLSVCYTKEARFSTFLGRANAKLAEAESANKDLQRQVESLTEQLDKCRSSEKMIKENLTSFQTQLQTSSQQKQKLSENVKTYRHKVALLEEELKSARTQHESSIADLEKRNGELLEALENSLSEFKTKEGQSSAKLDSATKLVEKYKSIAKTAVDRYIQLQASRLGLKSDNIKERLPQSYSFSDIDRICEDLQAYNLKVNSLPFNVASKKNIKMKITESKQNVIPSTGSGIDDEIDLTLSSFMK